MSLLLNQSQAQAAVDGMTVMNNVCAIVHFRFLSTDHTLHVKEYLTGEVNVWRGDAAGNIEGTSQCERYASQHEFAKAYGLGQS